MRRASARRWDGTHHAVAIGIDALDELFDLFVALRAAQVLHNPLDLLRLNMAVAIAVCARRGHSGGQSGADWSCPKRARAAGRVTRTEFAESAVDLDELMRREHWQPRIVRVHMLDCHTAHPREQNKRQRLERAQERRPGENSLGVPDALGGKNCVCKTAGTSAEPVQSCCGCTCDLRGASAEHMPPMPACCLGWMDSAGSSPWEPARAHSLNG